MSPKRKRATNKTKPRLKGKPAKTFGFTALEHKVAESFSLSAMVQRLLLAASFIVGVCLFLFGLKAVGLGVVAVSVLFFLADPFFQKLSSQARFGCLALGWLATAFALSSVHDYAAVMPANLILPMNGNFMGILFWAGFLLMVLAFRFSPAEAAAGEGVKPWQVILGLSLLLIVNAFITLTDLNIPPGFYWDDNATVIQDIRTVKDLHIYGIIMPASFREPAITYWTAWLWYLFPSETGLHMQRIGPVFMELAVILIMYLLGREVGSRRTGLLFAALGAFNKWYITETVWGSGLILVVLAVCGSFLCLLRIFRNPTWLNFILFGLSVAFGTYTYGAYRPFCLFMVLILFIWMLVFRGKWKADKWGWGLASFLMMMWFLVFLLKNGFLLEPFKTFMNQSAVFWEVVLTVLLILSAWTSVKYFSQARSNEIFLKFASALLIAAVLVYPLVTHPAYTMRVDQLNNFHNGDNPIHSLSSFLAKIARTFRELFMGAGFWGDSAFDFQSTWVILLGLAYFWARPTWIRFIFFIALGAGLAPHILSKDEYNGRALASTPSFLLLGTLGLERFWSWGAEIWERRSWNRFFALLLTVFFAWQIGSSFSSVFGHWYFTEGGEALVSRQIILDSPADRVYLSVGPSGCSPTCQGVLNEGHPVYILDKTNPIYLKATEVPQNVVVIVFAGDLALKARLNQEFPRAQWTGINFNTFHYPTAAPGDFAARFYRVFITADQLSYDKKKLIYLVKTPDTDWTRDFYCGSYGIAQGTIRAEDRVASLRAPFPTTDEVHNVTFESTFQAPVDGNYEFSAKDQNYVVLWVGGYKVLDMRVNRDELVTEEGSLYLKKGVYPIRYATFFRVNTVIPDIWVKAPDSSSARELDSFSR